MFLVQHISLVVTQGRDGKQTNTCPNLLRLPLQDPRARGQFLAALCISISTPMWDESDFSLAWLMEMESKGLDLCPGVCSATCNRGNATEREALGMQQYTLKQIKKGHIAPKKGFVKPSSLSLTVVKQMFRKNGITFCVQGSSPYMPSQLLLVNSLGTLWVSGYILGTSRSLIPTSVLNFAKTIYTQGCHSNRWL